MKTQKHVCNKCSRKKDAFQRAAVRRTSEAVPPIVNEVLRSPKQLLDHDNQVFMEPQSWRRIPIYASTSQISPMKFNRPTKEIFENQADQVADRAVNSETANGNISYPQAVLGDIRVHSLHTYDKAVDEYKGDFGSHFEFETAKHKPFESYVHSFHSHNLALNPKQTNGFPDMPAQRNAAYPLIHISQCQKRLQLQPASSAQTTEPTKEEIEQATAEEARLSAAKAGSFRVQYEKIARETIEKGKMEFSALNLDKEHKEVKEVNTPLKQEEVVDAIRNAWKAVFNKPVSPKFLALLIGKWKTEGGIKGIYNYNIGNLQVDVGTKERPIAPISDYAWRNAPEITKGKEEIKRSRFAAYDSIFQGAMGLIHYIVTKRPALWAAGESGNIEHYVYVMKSYNYFTAPVQDVKVRGKTVKTGYLTLMRSTTPKAETLEEPPIPSEEPKAAEGIPSDQPGPDSSTESTQSDYGSGGSGGASGSNDYGSGGSRGAGGGPPSN